MKGANFASERGDVTIFFKQIYLKWVSNKRFLRELNCEPIFEQVTPSRSSGKKEKAWGRSAAGLVDCPTKLREDINRKETFSFGHCPNERGGNYLNLFNPTLFGPLTPGGEADLPKAFSFFPELLEGVTC